MRTQSTSWIIRGALLLFGLIFSVTATLSAQHEMGAHRHPEAAKIKNPVAADAASIAAGQVLFDKHCAACHGDAGKGDGIMGDDMDPKPANLTDADWKHGSSDGEIFAVIRDGIKSTGMKSFSKKLTIHQIWDVINYVRSIGPPTSH
jgi:mono/diheme cytochrome c family protein